MWDPYVSQMCALQGAHNTSPHNSHPSSLPLEGFNRFDCMANNIGYVIQWFKLNSWVQKPNQSVFLCLFKIMWFYIQVCIWHLPSVIIHNMGTRLIHVTSYVYVYVYKQKISNILLLINGSDITILVVQLHSCLSVKNLWYYDILQY